MLVVENQEWSSALCACMTVMGFVIVNVTKVVEKQEWPSAVSVCMTDGFCHF